MQWLWIPVVVVVLVIFSVIVTRNELRDRAELIQAIRKELDEVRDEILEELRSVSAGK